MTSSSRCSPRVKIPRDEYERIDKLRDGFAEELEDVLKHARDTERQIAEALKALVYGFGAEIVNPRIDELKKRVSRSSVRSASSSTFVTTSSRTWRASSRGPTRNRRGSRRFSTAQRGPFPTLPRQPDRRQLRHRGRPHHRRDPPDLQEPLRDDRAHAGTAAGQSFTDFTRIKAGSSAQGGRRLSRRVVSGHARRSRASISPSSGRSRAAKSTFRASTRCTSSTPPR